MRVESSLYLATPSLPYAAPYIKPICCCQTTLAHLGSESVAGQIVKWPFSPAGQADTFMKCLWQCIACIVSVLLLGGRPKSLLTIMDSGHEIIFCFLQFSSQCRRETIENEMLLLLPANFSYIILQQQFSIFMPLTVLQPKHTQSHIFCTAS